MGRREMTKGTAATTMLAVKFSDLDVALLDALVAHAQLRAVASGSDGRRASRGSVLRDLVRASARAHGLVETTVETEEVSHG